MLHKTLRKIPFKPVQKTYNRGSLMERKTGKSMQELLLMTNPRELF